MNRKACFGNCTDRPGYCCCPGHIALHVFHIIARLDIQSAGVINDSLSHQDNRFFVECLLRLPFKNTENRRINATPVHRQKSAHFQGFNPAPGKNLNAESRLLSRLFDLLSECRSIQVAYRLINEIADEPDRFGQVNQPLQLFIIRAFIKQKLRRIRRFLPVVPDCFVLVK